LKGKKIDLENPENVGFLNKSQFGIRFSRLF